MPFKSQKQRAFMYSQHPKMAAQWQKETPSVKLPEYVGSQDDIEKKKKKNDFNMALGQLIKGGM